MNRASASFASIGSPAGHGLPPTTSRYQSASIASGIRIVRPNCSSGAAVSGMLLPTDELIFAPSHESEERRRQHDLRLEPVGLHHRAAGEQVVELVGAAELDVGLDRDRVVRLHQRVEQLGDRDRLAGGEALREVVALEQLRDGQRAGQPDDVGRSSASRATRRCTAPPSARGSRIRSACSR